MTRTLTIVLHEDNKVSLIKGGALSAMLASQLCIQAFQAFQRQLANEEATHQLKEKSEQQEK